MVLKCKNLKLHIGSCCISNFGTAETSLELQKPPMMQSPTALGVGVTARVTVRAVPLGTVSVVRARGAGVGAVGVPALGPMELGPPRAPDGTRRRGAASRAPGWYWAVGRISWFDSVRFARNAAFDRYWRSPTHLAHFPCCNSMGPGRTAE